LAEKYIFWLKNYILFKKKLYTFQPKVYTFQPKYILFSQKYILFSGKVYDFQKVYTFKYMIFILDHSNIKKSWGEFLAFNTK
jgi:hypothetical protein